MIKASAHAVLIFTMSIALSACGKSKDEQAFDAQALEASIVFDAEGCPVKVSEEVIVVRRRDVVTWRGVDAEGEQAKVPFSIVFSPLDDKAPRSRGSNLREMISAKAPAAEYKYTIVSAACPEKPLDPRIRVDP
ncbi:MAG: hypothetical protein AAGA95_11670 [Pseudomonadota bacterium]